ncbi:MAG TPA: aminotransferase class I/II-fold pyridoxal phosphate-dependent enzyme [Actinomycetota bacterium]|nr:aminotransferase class I/II-fold pyridoxal phosphate-dependent enzyme [Actinomycetota bacterium]
MSADDKLALDGGRPVRTEPWPTYDKGAVFVDADDEAAGRRALASRLYFRYDYRPLHETETGRFEAKLRDFFEVEHALALSSGTAAIALSLMAAGIEPGSEVACPAFSFTATPSAVMLAGCKPVLVEVDDELHFDVADLRRKFSDRMKAIVVVHMRGFASDIHAVLDFADDVGVPVFEDAVPALGASLNGKRLGTFGVAGAFSTQSDKSINTGEGGFLVTNDTALFARAVVLSGAYEGRLKKHFDGADVPGLSDLDLPLYNFRMDEIRAAVAASAMDRLPLRLKLHHEVYAHVLDGISDLDVLRVRQPVAPEAYLGESLIFRLADGLGHRAPWFARALCAEGIDARNLGDPDDVNVRCFWNWRFLFDTDDVDEIKATCPRTASLLSEAVDVPLSPTLSPEDCDQAVAAIRKVARALTA